MNYQKLYAVGDIITNSNSQTLAVCKGPHAIENAAAFVEAWNSQSTQENFKPCGCGWNDDKTYTECEDHAVIRKELEALNNLHVQQREYSQKYIEHLEDIRKLQHEKIEQLEARLKGV